MAPNGAVIIIAKTATVNMVLPANTPAVRGIDPIIKKLMSL